MAMHVFEFHWRSVLAEPQGGNAASKIEDNPFALLGAVTETCAEVH